MATDTKEAEAPVVLPEYDGNVFDDDGNWVDGPNYPSRELTATEVVARKLYEERQAAAAEGRESLTEHERVHRRLHPVERFSFSAFEVELVVNHATGQNQLRLKGPSSRNGRRSSLGGLTVTIPADSWSFEETSAVGGV